MLCVLGRRPSRFCDGHSRRHFLKIGGLALGGLSLPGILRAEESSPRLGKSLSHKAIIMIYLSGGPSHQDMYDLKMEAPARDSRLVPADPHQRAGHRNLRAHAAAGEDDGQVRHHPLALRLPRPAQFRHVLERISDRARGQARRPSVARLGALQAARPGRSRQWRRSIGLTIKTRHEPYSNPGLPGFLGRPTRRFCPRAKGWPTCG